MVNTKVTISGWELDNPVIAASGTFGYGKEFAKLYDINILGTFSFKGTTVRPRFGNPTPRIAESDAGILLSVGLQNPGMERVLAEELPEMKKIFYKKVIANLSGFSAEEYVKLCEAFGREEQVGILEVNVSCPNVKAGGMATGDSCENVSAIAKAVKQATDKPAYMKVTPNVTDIVAIAKACEEGGADGLTLVNTMTGMRIDLNSKKPIIANKIAGYAGKALFPVALRAVYQVYEAVNIPIIGIGGVSGAEDVVEMMLAGASAVGVGTANLINPYACKEIIENLPQTMKKYGIQSLRDIIGKAHDNNE